jgi:hypothetical protein
VFSKSLKAKKRWLWAYSKVNQLLKMKNKNVGLMNMRVSENMSFIARLERLEHNSGGHHHQRLRVLQETIVHQSPRILSRPSTASRPSTPNHPGNAESSDQENPHDSQKPGAFIKELVSRDRSLSSRDRSLSDLNTEEGKSKDDFDILINIVQSQQLLLNEHGEALAKFASEAAANYPTLVDGTPKFTGRSRPGSGQDVEDALEDALEDAPDYEALEARIRVVEDNHALVQMEMESDPEEVDMMAECVESLKELVINVKIACSDYESNHSTSSMMMKIREEAQSAIALNDSSTEDSSMGMAPDHGLQPQQVTYMLEELHWRCRKSLKVLTSIGAQEDAEESIRITALTATGASESSDFDREAETKQRTAFKERRNRLTALNHTLESSSRHLCVVLQNRISTARIQIALRELQETMQEVKDQKAKAAGKMEDIFKTVNSAVSMAQLMEGLKTKADAKDISKWSEVMRRIALDVQNMRDSGEEDDKVGQLRLDVQQLRIEEESQVALTNDQIKQIVTEMKRMKVLISTAASNQQYAFNDAPADSASPNTRPNTSGGGGGHPGIPQPFLEKQIRDIVKNKANTEDLENLRKLMESNGIETNSTMLNKSQFKCLSCNRRLPPKPDIDLVLSASQSLARFDNIDYSRPSTAPAVKAKPTSKKTPQSNQQTSYVAVARNQPPQMNTAVEIRSRYPRMVPALGPQKYRTKVASGGGGFGSVLRQ